MTNYGITRSVAYRYDEIGHGKGNIIWWMIKGRIRSCISKGGIDDFHHNLVKDADIDKIWRGRATRINKGIVTIIPPLNIYIENNSVLPGKIVDKLIKEFTPKEILASMAEEKYLRRVEL